MHELAWKEHFSPAEIAKLEPETGMTAFADALIKAARQKEKAAARHHHFKQLSERN